MRIAIDGNEANVSQRVGINQWAFELLRELSKVKSEHKIVVLLKDRPLPDLPPVSENFTYEVFGPSKAWVLTGLTFRLFRKPKIDVLFTPSHYIPLASNVKRVCSIVDLSFEKFGPEYFKSYDFNQLKRWTRLSAKLAKKIITISSNSKTDICELYKVSPEKVEVVFPGYNEEVYHPRIPLTKYKSVAEKYGIKRRYFLFVGTLQPRKNIVRLIRAFAAIKTNRLLVIVGKKGWLYEEILKEAEKLGVSNRVIFTGFAPNEDVAALMKYSLAYVLPSLYEGFGIPVVEAQATGAVVLVSRISSLPEVVGETGLYIENPKSVVSIRKGLQQVLNMSKKERLELKLRAKENAKRFSWKKAANQILGTLVSLVSGDRM